LDKVNDEMSHLYFKIKVDTREAFLINCKMLTLNRDFTLLCSKDNRFRHFSACSNTSQIVSSLDRLNLDSLEWSYNGPAFLRHHSKNILSLNQFPHEIYFHFHRFCLYAVLTMRVARITLFTVSTSIFPLFAIIFDNGQLSSGFGHSLGCSVNRPDTFSYDTSEN